MSIHQANQATSEAAAVQDKTRLLTISQQALTFAPTSPGKPSFQLITITQQGDEAPVELSTDAPDYFLLATDSHPNFAPRITFIPSSVGSYVHIRYLANHGGNHTGQLIVQRSEERQTISLTGRSSAFRLALSPYRPATVQAQSHRPGLFRKSAGLLAILLTSGLAYVAYTNRCQLFPALCSDSVSYQSTTPAVTAEPTQAKTHDNQTEIAHQAFAQKGKSKPQTAESSTPPRSVNQSTASVSSREPAELPKLTKPAVNESARRPRKAPLAEESDLELELNQPTRNPL